MQLRKKLLQPLMSVRTLLLPGCKMVPCILVWGIGEELIDIASRARPAAENLRVEGGENHSKA